MMRAKPISKDIKSAATHMTIVLFSRLRHSWLLLKDHYYLSVLYRPFGFLHTWRFKTRLSNSGGQISCHFATIYRVIESANSGEGSTDVKHSLPIFEFNLAPGYHTPGTPKVAHPRKCIPHIIRYTSCFETYSLLQNIPSILRHTPITKIPPITKHTLY